MTYTKYAFALVIPAFLLGVACSSGGDETGSGGDGDKPAGDGDKPAGDGDGDSGDGDGDSSTGGTAQGGCADCSNGCCDGDTCIPFGIQKNNQCGADGSSCSACEFGTMCDGAGSCETDPDICSPRTCAGCCEGNTCIDQDETNWDACGGGGEECGSCEYGTICSASGECTSDIANEAAFYIEIVDIELTASRLSSGGEAWDALSGADPMVCVSDLLGNMDCTTACEDTLTCSPDDGPLTGVLVLGSELAAGDITLTVQDEDGLDPNDIAGTATIQPGQIYSDPSFEAYAEVDFEDVVFVSYRLVPAE